LYPFFPLKITHSNDYARFLGYDVRVRRNGKIKRGGKNGCTKRTLSNNVELLVPFEDKINKFLFSKGVVKQRLNGTVYPTHRPALERLTDLEIVMTYNAELRGICNYYRLASNYNSLGYFAYLMEYSCLRTLAGKHKSKVSKIKEKFKDGHGKWGIPYTTKKGEKRCYFAKLADCKGAKFCTDILPNAFVIHMSARNTFENRLKAKVCELCGTTDAEHYEIHHIHKVKDLKGKEPWKVAMIAKRRKTMVVCRNCHNTIHH
jgi:RNA-directed DNA polymerase